MGQSRGHVERGEERKGVEMRGEGRQMKKQ